MTFNPAEYELALENLEFTGTTGRSATNNNPLNITNAPYFRNKYGAELEPTPKSGVPKFLKFKTMQDGYEAALDQIRIDQNRGAEELLQKYPNLNRYSAQMQSVGGHTLASFTEKFAPRNENPTDELIAQYSQALGVSPDTPLRDIPPDKLIVPMAARESSTRIKGGRPAPKFNPADYELVQDNSPFNPADYEIGTGVFASQDEALQGMAGVDLSFGMAPDFDPMGGGNDVFGRVKEILGFNKTPWSPTPLQVDIFREAMKEAENLPPLTPEEFEYTLDPETRRRYRQFQVANPMNLEDAPGAFIDLETRRRDGEDELRRVMGRFVDGYTADITTGAKKAIWGDTMMPQSVWGNVAGQAAYFAGQITGPFKLIKLLSGRFLFPTAEGLTTGAKILGRGMAEGAFNLGVLQGLSRIIPALIEDPDLTTFGKDVLTHAKSGAMVGAAFPLLGIIPGQGAVSKTLRMGTGFAALDYMRAAPGKWSTLGDFYNAYQTWDEPSRRQFSELAYQYILDIYFASSVPAIREQLAAHNGNVIMKEMAKLDQNEAMNAIMEVTGQRGKWVYDDKGQVAGAGEIRSAEPETPVNFGQISGAMRRATELYGAQFDEGLDQRIDKAITEALTPSLIAPSERAYDPKAPIIIETPASLRDINPDITPRIELSPPQELIGKGGQVPEEIQAQWEAFQRTDYARRRDMLMAQVRAEYPNASDDQINFILEERGFGKKPPESPTAPPERTSPETRPTGQTEQKKPTTVTPEPFVRSFIPKARRSYDVAKALEESNRSILVKDMGKIDPRSKEFQALEPEEKVRLLQFVELGGAAPDDMAKSLREAYPDLFPYETGDQLLRAMLDENIKGFNIDKEVRDYEEEHAARRSDENDYGYQLRKSLGISDADVERIQAESEGEVLSRLGAADDAEAVRRLEESGITLDNFWDFEPAKPPSFELKAQAASTKTETLPPEVAQIKRAFPDISDAQAEILAKDPELRKQMAAGNWEVYARSKVKEMQQASLLEPGGTLFYSGGPDTRKILDDLKSRNKTTYANGKQLWKDLTDNLRDFISPRVQPEVKQALITMMGRKQEAINQAAFKFLEFRSLLEKTPPKEWTQMAATWQKGGKTGTDFDRIFELYQKITDDLVPQIREFKDLFYQDWYLRQAWKNARNPDFRENVRAFREGESFKNYLDLDKGGQPRIYRAVFDDKGGYQMTFTGEVGEGAVAGPGEAPEGLRYGPGGRSLTGGRGYFKKKTISDWQTGMMLGGVPKFKNFMDLMMWDIAEKNQFIWGNKFMKWARDAGWMKYVLPGKIPQDWIRINDPRGIILHPYLKEIQETKPFEEMPGEYEMVKPEYQARVAQYILVAPREAGKAINNWLSPGLRGQPLYDLYRKMVDPLRTLGVSFSTFHLRFTMNNSMATGTGRLLSQAMGDVLSGDTEALKRTLKEGGENLYFKTFVKQLQEGKRLTQILYEGTNDPIGKQILREFIDSGGTIPDPTSMLPMWKTSGKALWEGLVELQRLHPFSAAHKWIEASSRPIMTYGVPFAKVGAFSILRRSLNERLDKQYSGKQGDPAELMQAREAEYRKGLFDINKHLDDIYGQMNYDSLMLNRAIKDMLFFAIKFPGWNIGSARYLHGKLVGLSKIARRQEPTEYEKESLRNGLGLVFNMGLYATLLHLFLNGKLPDDPTEVYTKGIWTGGYTRSGSKEYIRDATYWRDIWGMIPFDQNFAFDPGKPLETVKAKAADIWRVPMEVFENKEAYSGYQIASPGKPGQWPGEYANYIGKQAVPYSFRGMFQAQSPWGKFGSFGGLTPTPARQIDTPAMKEMHQILGAQAPQMVTVEKQAGRQVKRDIMDFAYEGDTKGFMSALKGARASGEITGTQYRNYLRDAKEIVRDPIHGPLRNNFRKVTDLGQALRVFTLATPEERYYLTDLMKKKWSHSKMDTRRKYRQEYLDMREAVNQ